MKGISLANVKLFEANVFNIMKIICFVKYASLKRLHCVKSVQIRFSSRIIDIQRNNDEVSCA